MEEPPMLSLKPSAAHSQDTSHVLASVFPEILCREFLADDIVSNLQTSRCGDRGYHDDYVEELQKATQAWDSILKRTNELEDMMVKAWKQARLLEEKEIERAKLAFPDYDMLGLPPIPSKLPECLDAQGLMAYDLVAPQSFLPYHKSEESVWVPESPASPQYMKMTISQKLMHAKDPPEDNYHPEPGPVLPLKTVRRASNSPLKCSERKDKVGKSSSATIGKNVWRQCMTNYQREIEKKDLSNMNSRAEYLKNPRYVLEASSTLVKASKEPIKLKASDLFKPSVLPVVFSNYEIGHTYEMTFGLKNITSACRKLCVHPPASTHFRISQSSQLTSDGLVAPGMSCNYVIYFTPDSLADFDDILQVKTQADDLLVIPLQGRRNSPRLTLTKELNCESWLVGGEKSLQFECRNLGGSGSFVFMEKTDDIASVDFHKIMALDRRGVLTVGPFKLEPAFFSIDSGMGVNVKVVFAPLAVKFYSLNIILVCDNCTVEEYVLSGSGEQAHVEILRADGLASMNTYEKYIDSSVTHIIQFPTQHPALTSSLSIEVANSISIPLSYAWRISVPCFKARSGSSVDANADDYSILSPFAISASEGALAPNAATEFKVMFSPSEVGAYVATASLVLLDIPIASASAEKDSKTEFISQDVTAVKVQLDARVEPFQVTVIPPILILQPGCLVGVPYNRNIQIRNDSMSPVKVISSSASFDDFSLEFQLKELTIDPGSFGECCITITGFKAARLTYFYELDVPHSAASVGFYIKADFQAPCIEFVDLQLDFGLVRFGEVLNKEIWIKNDSAAMGAWTIKEISTQDRTTCVTAFGFDFDKGLIQPYQRQKLSVAFRPYYTGRLQTYFECLVHDGTPSYLPVYADVQRPNVRLRESVLVIDDAFLDVPCLRTVTVINQALLPAEFAWTQLVGKDAGHVDVSFEPTSGLLKPHEQMDVTVTVIGHKMNQLEELYCACEISQMLDPIVLSLSVCVRGLDVDVYALAEGHLKSDTDVKPRLDCIDFGCNNFLGQCPSRLLVLENRSAIASSFSVWMESFQPARTPTPPSVAQRGLQRGIMSGGKRPLLLKATMQDRNARSEAHKSVQAEWLQNGLGASFVCCPSNGSLEAFSKQTISVTASANMWGEYWDQIICKVGDLPLTKVPVHADFIGSPLNFQLMKDQLPVVRFGTHTYGSDKVVRNMRINNTSHVDIRLDWQTYVLEPDDEQLVDLDLYIGEPFPLRNEKGDEIEKEDEVHNPLIKVTINEHQGTRSKMPFTVAPSQLIIPAKGWNTVEACFDPIIDVHDKVDFLGYALGFMSLEPKDKCLPGKFIRQDGLNMLPFALNMSGTARKPSLYLESCDDHGFVFEMPVSLLYKSCGEEFQLQDCAQVRHSYVLYNNTGTPIEYDCLCEEPFQVASLENRVNKRSTLKFGSSAQLAVLLNMTKDAVTSLLPKNNEFVVELRKSFKLVFLGNSTQLYPVTACIQYPQLQVTPERLEFGSCFVGDKRQLHFRLFNHSSSSACAWSVEKDPACPKASQDAFFMLKTKGLLEAYSSSTARHSDDFVVEFLPRHAYEYECRFIIQGLLFHRSLYVTVQGIGSYDEASREQSYGICDS